MKKRTDWANRKNHQMAPSSGWKPPNPARNLNWNISVKPGRLTWETVPRTGTPLLAKNIKNMYQCRFLLLRGGQRHRTNEIVRQRG